MNTTKGYVDLDGELITLDGLDAEERKLLSRIRRQARRNPDWCAFDAFWMREVPEFYDARGVSRKVAQRTAVYRIAQDMGARLGIAAGMIRPPDYRNRLESIVLQDFPSHRAFCKATGISEDLLSHVLAGRKDFSLATLEKGLSRIGYALRIRPVAAQKQTASKVINGTRAARAV